MNEGGVDEEELTAGGWEQHTRHVTGAELSNGWCRGRVGL